MIKQNHLAANLWPLGRFTGDGGVMKLSLPNELMLTPCTSRKQCTSLRRFHGYRCTYKAQEMLG